MPTTNVIIFLIIYLIMGLVLFRTKRLRGSTWYPFFIIIFTILYFLMIHPYVKAYYKNIHIVPVITLFIFPIAPFLLYLIVNIIDRIDFFIVKNQIQSGKFLQNGLRGKWLTNLRIKKTKKILADGINKNISSEIKEGLTDKLFNLMDGGVLSVTLILQLIQRGADFESPNKDGIYPLLIGRGGSPKNQLALLELGASTNVYYPLNRMTPLMFAARDMDCSVLHAMLRKGADTDAVDDTGKNALLHYSEKTAFLSKFVYYHELKIRETLLKICDIDSQDNNGKTPLMNAIKYSKKNFLVFLIKKSADVNIVDKDGKTALDRALRDDNQSFIKILKNAGALEGTNKQ